MRGKIFNSKLIFLIAFLDFLTPLESFATTKYISFGTGGITGVYYPAGGAICRLINRGRKFHGIRCSVESTGGSVANINGIRNNTFDFGVVQSDWQYHAINATGSFSDQKPFKELRSVFSLYTETFTVAVRDDSNIKNLDDIINARVNFGPKGSGIYATMETIVAAKNWNKEAFKAITYIQPSEQPKALCNNKIDVLVYAGGNPNGVIQEAAQTCRIRIIPIDDGVINELIKNNKYYVKSVIPGGMYAGNPDNINTFGVKATVVTSEIMSPITVHNMVKAVFENFDDFKTLHPVFSTLKREEMITDGNSAPLHPGALRYYREVGLMK